MLGKISHPASRAFWTLVGTYIGMFASASTIAFYGGNPIGVQLVAVLFFPFVALIGLVPQLPILWYAYTKESKILEHPILSTLTYGFIAGFISSESWILMSKIAPDFTGSYGIISAGIIPLAIVAASYAIVLALCVLSLQRGISKIITTAAMAIVLIIWIAAQYQQSFPHLIDLCNSLHEGDSRAKAEQVYATMMEKGVQDQFKISGQKPDGIFIDDGGVFCDIKTAGDQITEVTLYFDGP